MSEKKQDTVEFSQAGLVLIAILLVACLVSSIALGSVVHKVRLQAEALVADFAKCDCKPAPTPAACCKADECRKELDLVDARFGGVWDELVEVQEQLAKVKQCQCEPSKPCACSDKPACECKPSKSCECKPPKVKAQLPRHLIFKRCK